jgi:hypothetical protein
MLNTSRENEGAMKEEIIDQDYNARSWEILSGFMQIVSLRRPQTIDFQACVGMISPSGIWVLTQEAAERIDLFVKRNPQWKIQVAYLIAEVRKGSIDDMHVLDFIVNPYTSYWGKCSNNHVLASVNHILIGNAPASEKIQIFVKNPELGD